MRINLLNIIWLPNKWHWLIIVSLAIGIIVYSFKWGTINQPYYTYKKYCGNCHLLPNPQEIPKHIWQNNVLPEMAARLGYQFNEKNHRRPMSMEEAHLLSLTNTYPEKPLISSQEWEELYKYIMSQAPDSLPIINRKTRSKPLKQFTAQSMALDNKKGALVTYLNFNTVDQSLYLGNGYGELYRWENAQKFNLIGATRSPIMGYKQYQGAKYLTEIGIMPPSEIPAGKIWEDSKNGKVVIADKLHRPVFADFIDLNQDNEPEILIGEFGNEQGELSMLKKNTQNKYEKTTLLNFAGIVRVIPNDMNKDGYLDLIVLTSQGREGVYILFNDGNFNFALRNLIQLKPHYGISWFELQDYDNDGDLDIILVNGDNADYSPTLKPYHGLRIYLNNGNNQFEEAFFYPIYGATRVIARDFDQDKDIDFAITAFFPDFDNNLQESFIYLETINAKKYEFQNYTFEQAAQGRWMVMESGDFDQDGDEDLILGSFDVVSGSKNMMQKWQNENIDLIWLKNQLKNPSDN